MEHKTGIGSPEEWLLVHIQVFRIVCSPFSRGDAVSGDNRGDSLLRIKCEGPPPHWRKWAGQIKDSGRRKKQCCTSRKSHQLCTYRIPSWAVLFRTRPSIEKAANTILGCVNSNPSKQSFNPFNTSGDLLKYDLGFSAWWSKEDVGHWRETSC